MRFWAFVFVVAAMLAATQASAKPEVIEFSDLVDPLAVVFDDPYRDMGFRLLNELKLVVELDEKLAQKDLAEDERARLTARRNAAKDMLEINGQDVDALLAQRWDVAKKRQTARMATNPVSGQGRGYAIGLSDSRAKGRRWHVLRLPGPPGGDVQPSSAAFAEHARAGEIDGRPAGPVSLCTGSGDGPAPCRTKRCHHIHPRWRGAHAQRLDP